MTRIRVSLLLLACVPAMAGTALEPFERVEQHTRRVSVAAVDEKGGPVIDLTAAGFAIKEKPRIARNTRIQTNPKSRRSRRTAKTSA